MGDEAHPEILTDLERHALEMLQQLPPRYSPRPAVAGGTEKPGIPDTLSSIDLARLEEDSLVREALQRRYGQV